MNATAPFSIAVEQAIRSIVRDELASLGGHLLSHYGHTDPADLEPPSLDDATIRGARWLHARALYGKAGT